MSTSAYGWCLTATALLWALWLAALACERGWFRVLREEAKAVDPLTRALLAALCTFCTVTAQKPAGAARTPVLPPDGVADAEPAGDGAVAATSRTPVPPLEAESLPSASGVPADAPAGTPRVVFQSAPASDPRAAAAFLGQPGWEVPAAAAVAPGLDALSFNGGGTNAPSPVRYPGEGAVAVRTLILAARGSAADLATLADAPEPDTAERALAAQFEPNRWLVVALDFGAAAALGTVHFGGTAGLPGWARNWRGEIAEIVGFDEPPGADVRAGVANYLSVRWGFLGHPATREQRQAAADAGLSSGSVWGSVLVIR